MKGLERRYYQSMSESNFTTIKKMIRDNISEMNINIGEKPITINNTIANKIVSVHESLSKENKKKMEEMLNESVDSFKKIISFAIRQ
jgi:DNA-binding ferritin-like protein